MSTVRDAVFEMFRERGMTTIFGNPGSTELPMLADYPSDFRYVLGLQEAVAVGMADGYAQASGIDHPRQPPHRPRRRQRHGGDLQRPGQPLAAAGHGRPAGALADDAAGQPDQPRRRADAAPAREVELRAAARRGRAPRARPRHPPGGAAAAGPRVRLDPDGRLGRRGRPAGRAAPRLAQGDGPRGRRPRGRHRTSRGGWRPPEPRRSSPGPTSTRAAPGTPPSRSPSASSIAVWATPAPGRRADRLPRGPPRLPGHPRPRDRPRRRAARRATTSSSSPARRSSPTTRTSPATCSPRAPRWSRSRAIPTRRRGRRWATRSSPTSRSRSRRCSPSSPRATARRRRSAPGARGARAELAAGPRQRARGARRRLPRRRDRRARVAVVDPRAAQPAAPQQARQLLLRRRRRPRLRPRRRRSGCRSPSPTGGWSASSARARPSTRSRACGPRPPTRCR